jgi:hypothetical protein
MSGEPGDQDACCETKARYSRRSIGMRMSEEDKKKYPDLYYWLKYDLPMLPLNKPKVYAAFRRYAPRPQTAGRCGLGCIDYLCLLLGYPPTIQVNSTDMMECKKDGEPERQKDGSYIQKYELKWYGFTSPRYEADLIFVASDLARSARSSGEDGLVLEATVLHELVHWCRLKTHADVNDEGPPYAFEKEAYGKVMQRTWQSCMSEAYFKVE